MPLVGNLELKKKVSLVNEVLKTDKGKIRDDNEDSLGFEKNSNEEKIYILCDGMGGYKGGAIASFECVKFIKNKFKKSSFTSLEEAKKWLYETIIASNKKIVDLSKKNTDLVNMGTTIVCLIVSKDFRVYASVGDSRIYAYNHKELIQLSEDQTFANALLKAGYINEKEAKIHPKKSVLLSAIGSSDEDLDIQINEVASNYNYLICSDGLYNMVENKDILKIINTSDNLDTKASKLIDCANNNGGHDNISVILLEESL
jgi:protein phosphatase